MGGREIPKSLQAYAEALETSDLDRMVATFEENADDDFVQEWPQSGERIRGKDNFIAINKNYPGIPSMKLRDIKGDGDVWAVEITLDYGQGPVHGVSIFELRDGKLLRETDYFADPFEAPEWRAQWVERM